ncbi:MAG: hypothetical protein QF570_00285 [Myxococcota bacterium]|jgi:hypothetical protein|nr:hypothetical protein [Myxococcota bacterium]
MTRPVLLHIGFHKTGTTFLQDHLFGKSDRGFASPWSVVGGQPIQHFVLENAARFSPGAVAAEFLEAADAMKVSPGALPVISHEDLCGYPVNHRYYGHEAADKLHATFPEAKVLIGIREQRSMLRSHWGQYIKQDGEWPMTQFFGSGSEPPGFLPICRLDHFEYDLLIEHYFELFGRERVLVLPYELLRENSVGYEQAIHDFCETGLTAEEAHPASNVGMGALTLKIRRVMNRFTRCPPLWGGDWDSLPRSYRAKQRACRILQQRIPKSWHEKEDRRIREFIDARVGTYYRESNKKLSDITGIDLSQYGYDL